MKVRVTFVVSDEDVIRARDLYDATYNLDAAGHSYMRAERIALRAVLEDFASRKTSSTTENP